MLDDELMNEMEKSLPKDTPHLFFISLWFQIAELKDILWTELSKDQNRHITITHHDIDTKQLSEDLKK